jgi:serine/threonine-protein kinase
LVGRLLDRRYRVLDRIARGGMSTVYRGVDERLDRAVAIKVMSPDLSADPAFTDRFEREARAAARLSHVNVVAVHDQGVEYGPNGPSVFLVMELVRGRTLRDLIRERGGRFSPAEAVSLLAPVLSALAAAHRAGLVHRDVKPENILLSDEGVVKVADFGLARAVNSDVAATRTGLMMGTVAYCAPEQITRGRVSPRSDVYAAGILLFELLTGRPPYTGDSPMAVAYQHVHSRVPAPSSRSRGVPPELDEVVIAATDSDPDGRPSDAAAMLADLADARITLRLPVVPVPLRDREKPSPAEVDAPTTALRQPYHPTRVGPPARRPAPAPARPPVRASRRVRRRRGWVLAVLVLLLGALCAAGGVAAAHWVQGRGAHASAQQFPVPLTAGMTELSARRALTASPVRLSLVTRRVPSADVPTGRVTGTRPAAGTRVQPGARVILVVSAGPPMVAVPHIGSGEQVAEATAALRAVGLVASLDRSYDGGIFGRVVSVDPEVGRQVPKGWTVTLTVV